MLPIDLPTIAYLGPEGSHSHQAALQFVQQQLGCKDPARCEAVLKPCENFETLLAAVDQPGSQIQMALLPIENALEGSVTQVMEALSLKHPQLVAYCELIIPVIHCLIQGAPGPVHTILSHPQALAQCRETLKTLFGDDVKYEATSSTSRAAHLVREKAEPGLTAVGTLAAASLYGLHVLKEDISDAPDNRTRFLLVGHRQTPVDLPLWANLPRKMSFCIGLADRPGVLADLLLVFKAYQVNLTRIESRPSKKKMGEYLFYLDTEVPPDPAAYDKVMLYLQAEAQYLHTLGPYASLGVL
ncbi:MAG: prephenate dehydratase [Candidatus Melainabacteria bacterium]